MSPVDPVPTPPAPSSGTPAEWPQRALAYLIDIVPVFVVIIVGVILGAILGQIAGALGSLVMMLGYLAGLGFVIYNYGVKQGTTGYTVGKAIVGLKLVDANTGQPVGTGLAVARYFVHIVDAIPCYIGFLWPLWDAKKETFADKILTHAVVVAPKVDPKELLLGK